MICRVPEAITDARKGRRPKVVWDSTGKPTVPSSLLCRFAQLGGHCGADEGRTHSEAQPTRPPASSRLSAAHRHIVRLLRPRVRRGDGAVSGYVRAAMEALGDGSRGTAARPPPEAARPLVAECDPAEGSAGAEVNIAVVGARSDKLIFEAGECHHPERCASSGPPRNRRSPESRMTLAMSDSLRVENGPPRAWVSAMPREPGSFKRLMQALLSLLRRRRTVAGYDDGEPPPGVQQCRRDQSDPHRRCSAPRKSNFRRILRRSEGRRPTRPDRSPTPRR